MKGAKFADSLAQSQNCKKPFTYEYVFHCLLCEVKYSKYHRSMAYLYFFKFLFGNTLIN